MYLYYYFIKLVIETLGNFSVAFITVCDSQTHKTYDKYF